MTESKFTTQSVSTWPSLAWVATCESGSAVHVLHGTGVETGEDWFGEVVWDGPFSDLGFDQAEFVFGSGGRQRNHQMRFAGSTSVLDRLQWFVRGNTSWVSNSLPGLMQVAGLTTDPFRTDYPEIFRSICQGLRRYRREIPMREGFVQLTYMEDLIWDGSKLVTSSKKQVMRKWESFEEYRDDLIQIMKRLGQNWKDPTRRNPLEGLSTISTGYDSPTATVLGKSAGVKETLTIRKGRTGAVDDGSSISRSLGLLPHVVDRDDWQKTPFAEAPFLASDGKGEDVYFAGAGDLLRNRVLLTGYGGTRVWGLKSDLCEEYQRGDQSGLSHTEARLHLGYIHIPVPFILANQTSELRKISVCDSMRNWHVDGPYNCPIARRIVEEAGIDRSAFGMQKKAASVLLFDRKSFLAPESLRDFYRWYYEHFRGTKYFANLVRHVVMSIPCRLAGLLQSAAIGGSMIVPLKSIKRLANSSRLAERAGYQQLFPYLFSWAMERTVSKYAFERAGNSNNRFATRRDID